MMLVDMTSELSSRIGEINHKINHLELRPNTAPLELRAKQDWITVNETIIYFHNAFAIGVPDMFDSPVDRHFNWETAAEFFQDLFVERFRIYGRWRVSGKPGKRKLKCGFKTICREKDEDLDILARRVFGNPLALEDAECYIDFDSVEGINKIDLIKWICQQTAKEMEAKPKEEKER